MLAGLTVVASVSPLLTLAAFWQLKEWRLDRVQEHLGREGWTGVLFGSVRPLVLAAYAVAVLFSPDMWIGGVTMGALLVLAGLAGAQLLLRRQPHPVWTLKAKVIVAAGLLLNLLLSVILARTAPVFLPLLPLLQAVIVTLCWLAFWPVDYALKRRTFEKAIALRGRFSSLTAIGITGSVGKTTTKELIAHVLGDDALATPEHVNSEMGVAQWLLRALPSSEKKFLIVEMGAYRSGEIANLCRIVQPSLGVITFIGTQHMALFGSQEALINAKGELLESLPEDGHAFLNGDCAPCAAMRTKCRCPVTVVGTGGANDLEAFDIEETPHGIRFTADGMSYTLPLHGTHNVVNVLLAIAVCRKAGLSADVIAKRLRTFVPPHRTFEVRTERGVTLLDDTYNASAASFKAAIAWARSQPFEQKTLLTDGIIELGEEHERTHRELGASARDVFQRVIFLHEKTSEDFAQGYGKPLEFLEKMTPDPVQPGSLLVCVGQMPPSVLRRLLPSA